MVNDTTYSKGGVLMNLFDVFKKHKIPIIKNIKSSNFEIAGTTDNKPNMVYDLDSIEGIQSIPIPQYKAIRGIASPVNNIEYILQRKATEHKQNGRMDLAIACLKKSNEIMPHSNLSWQPKDYLRLIEYLKLSGRFEEARNEEAALRSKLPYVFDEVERNKLFLKRVLSNCRTLNTDLIEILPHGMTCGECSIYQDRVYSISGKDSRFPKLPEFIFKYGGIHPGCRHTFCAYVIDMDNNPNKTIIRSNRPFVDSRTKAEKEKYDEIQRKKEADVQDKLDYDYLREHLSDLCPKSISGYKRMKASNSENYQKLVIAARNIGYDIK